MEERWHEDKWNEREGNLRAAPETSMKTEDVEQSHSCLHNQHIYTNTHKTRPPQAPNDTHCRDYRSRECAL